MTVIQSKFSANTYWTDLLYHIDPNGGGVSTFGANDPSWNADVQSKILATGFFPNVDAFNAAAGTPTLAQLKSYTAVLIYSDSGFADPVAFGNNAADYVDAGGGVVLATFDSDNGNNLQGRWNTDGYDALTVDGQGGGGDLTIGTVFFPGHPVMVGVTSFDGGGSSFHNTGAPTVNTSIIANWSDTSPLVIEKTGFTGKIIMLNFYPPSSDIRGDFWLSSTQGGLLMGNALKYVGS